MAAAIMALHVGVAAMEPAPAQPAGAPALRQLEALAARYPKPPDDPSLIPYWANLQSAVRNARFLHAHYVTADPRTRADIAAALDQAERCRAILDGQRERKPEPGLAMEGYHAANDDSFQPFVRYLPATTARRTPHPLIVYLHGYSPQLDRVNWTQLPQSLLAFAARERMAVVAPFGRGNTDFQGIGEQDVLRVIDAMERRHAIDSSRILLAGFSMGGMGAWTIATRHPHRFAGLLVVAGRGDYYFWHKLKRAHLPGYKQRLIDAAFGVAPYTSLANLPIFCLHGANDWLVDVTEARHMLQTVRAVNPDAIYREIEGGTHWIVEETFMRRDVQAWIRALQPRTKEPRTQTPPSAAPPLSAAPPHPAAPPLRGGRITAAFLDAFAFIDCADADAPLPHTRFANAVRDWEAFAHATPRTFAEPMLDLARLAPLHVFLFGEPESSATIRKVLATSPVTIRGNRYVVGKQDFPRQGNGLYVARPSPWGAGRIAVVQCGLGWGAALPVNHKYDLLPDYIVYSNRQDADASNTALCAGFFDEQWQLDPTLMDRPTEKAPAAP